MFRFDVILDEMNKFVFKTNFLFNNYYLQRKCLALKTPAAVNSNNFIDSEKSKVNGTVFIEITLKKLLLFFIN